MKRQMLSLIICLPGRNNSHLHGNRTAVLSQRPLPFKHKLDLSGCLDLATNHSTKQLTHRLLQDENSSGPGMHPSGSDVGTEDATGHTSGEREEVRDKGMAKMHILLRLL